MQNVTLFQQMLAEEEQKRKRSLHDWVLQRVKGGERLRTDLPWLRRDEWPNPVSVVPPVELDGEDVAVKAFLNYYLAEEWEAGVQERFRRAFEIRRHAHCETCPELGTLTWHHVRRSVKEHEIAGILSRWLACNLQHRVEEPQLVPGVDDEDLLIREMGKCVVLCRPCHDKVHNLEKKLENAPAFQQYLKQLRQHHGTWLDANKIEQYARWSAS